MSGNGAGTGKLIIPQGHRTTRLVLAMDLFVWVGVAAGTATVAAVESPIAATAAQTAAATASASACREQTIS